MLLMLCGQARKQNCSSSVCEFHGAIELIIYPQIKFTLLRHQMPSRQHATANSAVSHVVPCRLRPIASLLTCARARPDRNNKEIPIKNKFTVMIVLLGCAAVPMFGQSIPSSLGQGINLKVDSSHKVEGKLPTINAALKLLPPAMSNTVTVSGSCIENILIQGFDHFTPVTTTGATP